MGTFPQGIPAPSLQGVPTPTRNDISPVAPQEVPLPVGDIPWSAELDKMDVLQLPIFLIRDFFFLIPSGTSSLPTQVFQPKSHPLVTKHLWAGTCICSGPKAHARSSPSGEKKRAYLLLCSWKPWFLLHPSLPLSPPLLLYVFPAA